MEYTTALATIYLAFASGFASAAAKQAPKHKITVGIFFFIFTPILVFLGLGAALSNYFLKDK